MFFELATSSLRLPFSTSPRSGRVVAVVMMLVVMVIVMVY